MGMLSVFEYLTYLFKAREHTVGLGEEKVPPVPRRFFGPLKMTLDTWIVPKWVPKTRVEHLESRFLSF